MEEGEKEKAATFFGYVAFLGYPISVDTGVDIFLKVKGEKKEVDMHQPRITVDGNDGFYH
jgi:hypothetical protein